jgi:hypothetical protein
VLLGAVCASVVATAMFAAASIANNAFSWADLGIAGRAGIGVGGTLGAPFAPALGFAGMRWVPLGRAIVAVTVWPILAAVIGAALDYRCAVPFALVALMLGPYWPTRRQPLRRQLDSSSIATNRSKKSN